MQLLIRTNVCVKIKLVMLMKYYLCIDLKTFFASVECVERNLDPFKTDLIVADISRNKGAICLAISPKMKSRGIKNRCRIYDIPKNVHPIIAKPRMMKYIEYSCKIYDIYLKYVSSNDIHVYSIDEAFFFFFSYVKLYKKNPLEIAKMIMKDIYDTTGITATCGIGTNLYLTKIALDIISKHVKDNIGYLTEERFKKLLWHHTTLTDMYDIAHYNESILYKEFGVNAKLLIDHSKGIEPCLISDIKEYKSKSNSLSNSQILFSDYSADKARIVLSEMIDNLVLKLVSKELYTDVVGFYIGYSKDIIKPLKVSKKLDNKTNSYSKILKELLIEYDYRINSNYKIRRIGIWFSNITHNVVRQLDIFHSYYLEDKDENIDKVVNNIKNKYGKNTILRAISYKEGANQIKRNKLIGGHNAE